MSNGNVNKENDVSDKVASDSGDESDDESCYETNYNTITSLDALKEIISNNTNGSDNLWFKHYFLRHVNRLPSRHQYQGRRLSQCREEDEGNELDAKFSHDKESSKGSETQQCQTKEISEADKEKPPLLAELFKVPKSTLSSDQSLPPPSCTNFPRIDKHFFDSSLVEMRSQASSTSTIEYDSADEEVWVKRVSDNLNCHGSKLVSILQISFVNFLGLIQLLHVNIL